MARRRKVPPAVRDLVRQRAGDEGRRAGQGVVIDVGILNEYNVFGE